MTENDPFLNKPAEQQPKYHPASGLNPGQSHEGALEPKPADPTPPQQPAPGMIAGAAAPTYGAPGQQTPFSQRGEPLEPPTALGNSLLAVMGVNALIGLAVAASAGDVIDLITEYVETGTVTGSTGSPLGSLTFPLTVASYVLYGMWMMRMRRNRKAMGDRPGLPGVEWWGWFVPFAGVVLVPWGARKVAGRTTSLALLLGWWLTFMVSNIAATTGIFAILGSVDFDSNEITDAALLNSYTDYVWASAVLMVISWAFLFGFVRQATTRHLDRQA
ncbi:DUF4328 domain-containing protein [Demequina subtropica]|uniref:DUF4328 domain-containing protein n=1 Tax=Demequina subtropica TaxID=1638989 RepID=UPI000784E108|nr:DUF4328 domain-containing protein [Demequina subtropica]